MNYLFDLINEIAGYTEKYYDESLENIDHAGLVKKYRAERTKYTDSGLNKSKLLGDHHPHCLMVIEGIQELHKMAGCNICTRIPGKPAPEHALPVTPTRSLAQDYLDALVIRLTPNNDLWYRNHFPVVLETNMSHYYNELVYNDMNYSELTFPTIEFGLPSGDGSHYPA